VENDESVSGPVGGSRQHRQQAVGGRQPSRLAFTCSSVALAAARMAAWVVARAGARAEVRVRVRVVAVVAVRAVEEIGEVGEGSREDAEGGGERGGKGGGGVRWGDGRHNGDGCVVLG
jgi:hypothetical protein